MIYDITTGFEAKLGMIFKLHKCKVLKVEACNAHTLRMDFTVK